MDRALSSAPVPLLLLPRRLTFDDVAGRDLNIIEVNIAQATDTSGAEVLYPVVRFAEIPDAHYVGGLILWKRVFGWALASGDKVVPGVPVNLNDNLKKVGGVPLWL